VDLGRPLEIPLRRRAIGAIPLLRASILVPAIDLLSLLSAIAVMSRFDILNLGYVALTLLLLNMGGVRSNRIDPRIGEDLGWILVRVAAASVVMLPAGLAEPKSPFMVLPVVAVFVITGRAAAYALARSAKVRRATSDPTVVVGAGLVAAQLGTIVQEHPEYGLKLVGFIDHSPQLDLPAPLLGGPENLRDIVREFQVERIIVAFGSVGEGSLVSVLRSCAGLGVRLHVVPRLFELGGDLPGAVADDLWGIPVVPLANPASRSPAKLLKRAMDVGVSSLLLLLAAPLLLAVAAAVRATSPGPVLFRQIRVGRNGREFRILKFRTMYVNDESDTRWNVDEDERITPVGRVLRRLSIDELPQLANVLRGDMSIVGPRPERPHYVGRFSETVTGYTDRHRVDVGITGWAQIHGRSRDLEAIPERARFDNYYIEHWSIWRDIVIIARTVRTVFGTRG